MILLVCPLLLAAVAVIAVTDRRAGSRFNISAVAIFPATFVALTAFQLVPLPPSVVAIADPQGSTLLAEGGGGTGGWRPLSLDPPRTQEASLRSLLALVAFLATYHLAAKRRGRSWILRAVAVSGVAAVVIGLGHRVFAIPKIFGLFPNPRHLALLAGPFINANHNAEFLELATFVNIACSRQATSQLSKLAWNLAAAICAGGAIATLSRASVAALGVGIIVLTAGQVLQRRPEREERPRRWWLPAVVGVGAVCVFALSIGAFQILDRFREHVPSRDGRFELWRDSLLVLKAHPLGIGRGAFGTVYPAYRTLPGTLPVRFEFVENEPLQMLIDFGVVGFIVLVLSAIIPVRSLFRQGRGDALEFALLAGLAAVAAHACTDFGLETLGLLLPFSAVLGVLLGRKHRRAESPTPDGIAPYVRRLPSPRAYLPVAAAILLSVVSLGTLAVSRSTRNFDAGLKAAKTPHEYREILAAARRAHPLDYYYPLLQSTLEPLVPQTGSHSPRLRVLNQALKLCPSCSDVYLQIARAMWRLGRRHQALAEWARATKGQNELFLRSLTELTGQGANASELERAADGDPSRLLTVAQFLLTSPHPEHAGPVLSAAEHAGAPPLDAALLRARMALMGPDQNLVEEAVAAARRLAPGDSRVALIEAERILKTSGVERGAAALAVLERAVDADPDNLELQRKRMEVVGLFERWSAAERAISGFKQALQASGGSTVEANLAAAEVYVKMGRTREAFAEYRIASTAEPGSPTVWRQFASTATATGHYVLAREAYSELMRLAPDQKINDEIRRLDNLRAVELREAATRGSLKSSP